MTEKERYEKRVAGDLCGAVDGFDCNAPSKRSSGN
jgi:hypothetical protein